MDKFDPSIIQQFKDFASLQQFAESQKRTIDELTQKIATLQDENLQLKSLHESTAPLFGGAAISNEELICLKQIQDMKQISDSRPLTLDETRRLDILIKNLQTVRASGKKDSGNSFTDLPVAELHQLLKE